MNKSEQREVEMIRKYIIVGMTDTAARALSALIRAARTNKSRAALMELAGSSGWGLINHPEFII